MQKTVLGIDIGGTNTTFALINRAGEILLKENVPTGQYADPKFMVQRIREILESQTDLIKNLAGIGIGAPNGNYYKGTIEFAPNLQWSGIIPLAKYFEDISCISF